jgi:hypothetical protein
MTTTDIIRAVLDIIDNAGTTTATVDAVPNEPGEQTSRFKQIFAMLQNPSDGPYANTPNEIVTNVDSVTTDAGGGLNGPKHVDDLRVKDPRGWS